MEMKAKAYDRTTQDVGNIVLLEHWNIIHTNQQAATAFYVMGMGGTRDPYLFPGLENMWINFGRTQVHLPSRDMKAKPQVMRGTMGYVMPDLEALKQQMKRAAPYLEGTKFSCKEKDGAIEATDPYGNRIRCHAPSPQYGSTEMGLVYIDFDVPKGTAAGIARFYNDVMKAPASAKAGRATVSIGRSQRLYFTETAKKLPEYDGHHFQIYIADFSGPYKWLKERDLITMETDEMEWRIQWIVDPKDARPLFQIEHEVRSMKHRLFNRPLVNRNPSITNMTYVPGTDAFRGTY
jgi:hypothetical protein